MKINAYNVITQNLAGDILAGLRKAAKWSSKGYSDDELQAFADQVYVYVTNGLCEVIDFDEGQELELAPPAPKQKTRSKKLKKPGKSSK